MLGSRLGPTDIYQRMMEEYPDWPLIKYPAILPHCRECHLAGLECEHPESERMLWPDYPHSPGQSPYEALMKVKARVKGFWFSSFMQEEGAFEDMVFKPDSLNAAKDGDFILGQVPSSVQRVFIGCDPAIRQFCAIITWGIDLRTGQRYLIDIFNEKGLGHWDNVVEQIRQAGVTHGASVAAIEMNNVQGSIHNNPRYIKALRSVGMKIEPYQTRSESGARAEGDDFDISTIGALFDSGLVVLPYGNESSRAAVDKYIAQLLDWRPGAKHLTRDMVMATLFAESEAMKEYQRSQSRSTQKYVPKAPKWVARRWKERQRASA